jgi:hypothetical protein
MKSMNGKDIAEFVGIGAIVASLIFVGLQLRQSHEIALSEAWQQRSAMVTEVFLALSDNEAAIDALIAANPRMEAEIIDGVALDGAVAFEYWMYGMMSAIENVHYQYRLGYISEEGWQKARGALVHQLRINALTGPGLDKYKTMASSSFIQEIERIEADAKR